jgi:hypothetical protein
MTSTTSPQKPATTNARQTQRGVARAATAAKKVAANKAAVRDITTARKTVEQQVEQAFIAATKDMSETAEEKAARHQALAVRRADQAAQEAAEQKLSPTKRTRKPVEVEEHVYGVCAICGHDVTEAQAAKIKLVTDNPPVIESKLPGHKVENYSSHKIKPVSWSSWMGLDNAAKVVEDAATKQLDEWLATTPAVKPRVTKEATKQLGEIKLQADKLALVEKEIAAKKLTERALAEHELGKARNELILKLIKLDAGYSFIAKTRGIAPSTNRGLCRVLEGGKRI